MELELLEDVAHDRQCQSSAAVRGRFEEPHRSAEEDRTPPAPARVVRRHDGHRGVRVERHDYGRTPQKADHRASRGRHPAVPAQWVPLVLPDRGASRDHPRGGSLRQGNTLPSEIAASRRDPAEGRPPASATEEVPSTPTGDGGDQVGHPPPGPGVRAGGCRRHCRADGGGCRPRQRLLRGRVRPHPPDD